MDILPIPTTELDTVNALIAEALHGTDIAVLDEADYKLAAAKRKQCRELVAKLEETRKIYTAPLDAEKKNRMAFFAKLAAPLEEASKELMCELGKYDREQERKRAEEQRKLEAVIRAKAKADAEAAALIAIKQGKEELAERVLERAAAEPVAVPQLAPAKPIAGTGMSYRDEWRAEVVSPEQIPREFLMPDEKKIRAIVRETKGNLRILGVRIWCDKIPVQR